MKRMRLPLIALAAAGALALSACATGGTPGGEETTAPEPEEVTFEEGTTMAELNEAVFYDTNPIPMKYMMKRLGIMPKNEHRLPMMPATRELEKRLDGVLDRAGLLNGRAKKKAA